VNRRTRNALAVLLHEALEVPGARLPIDLLHRCCQHLRAAFAEEVPLSELLDLAREEGQRAIEVVLQTILRLAAAGSLLRIRAARSGGAEPAAAPAPGSSARWLVALAPEAQEERDALEERLRAYRAVLTQTSQGDRNDTGEDPLARSIARAAVCFNAGLFFEAHEILEQQWLDLPQGALRRFLQGLIQISVGFHHAQGGRFFGAVNQLGKGLEKTLARPEVAVGRNGERFFARVQAIREGLLARGPQRMGPLGPQDVPRMPVRFD
jgi:hypothetical protein